MAEMKTQNIMLSIVDSNQKHHSKWREKVYIHFSRAQEDLFCGQEVWVETQAEWGGKICNKGREWGKSSQGAIRGQAPAAPRRRLQRGLYFGCQRVKLDSWNPGSSNHLAKVGLPWVSYRGETATIALSSKMIVWVTQLLEPQSLTSTLGFLKMDFCFLLRTQF